SMAAFSESFQTASQGAQLALRGLQARIEGIEAPPDLLRKRVEAMTAGAETALTGMRDQALATSRSIEGLGLNATNAAPAVARIQSSVQVIDEMLAQLERGLKAINTAGVGRVNSELNSLTNDVHTARKNLGTIASGVNEMVQLLDSKLRP